MSGFWRRHQGVILEVLETLLLAAFIFFASRLVVQNFRVEGRSMMPSLSTDDLVLVTKISYLTSAPDRGDVMVISKPSQQREDLVKRVVGLPHETVEIRDGKVYVNGIGLDESAYIENPGNFSMPPVVLGADAYFVLGDNRRESEDSRRFGPVPARAIIGKVWFVYWPFEFFGLFPEMAPTREPLPVRTGADDTVPAPSTAAVQLPGELLATAGRWPPGGAVGLLPINPAEPGTHPFLHTACISSAHREV